MVEAVSPGGPMELPVVSVDSDSVDIAFYVRALHALPEGSVEIDSDFLDRLLLEKETSVEAEASLIHDPDTLKARYQGEQPWDGTKPYIWTPYNIIKAMVKRLDLDQGKTFYDLGSGYGRVILYAGMVTAATCKGVEMVEERAVRAERMRRRFELDNVEFTNASVLDYDFSDGDVFYMYAPFSERTRQEVMRRLERHADRREKDGQGPITIASRYCPGIDRESWLTATKMAYAHPYFSRLVDIYQSVPKSRR